MSMFDSVFAVSATALALGVPEGLLVHSDETATSPRGFLSQRQTWWRAGALLVGGVTELMSIGPPPLRETFLVYGVNRLADGVTGTVLGKGKWS